MLTWQMNLWWRHACALRSQGLLLPARESEGGSENVVQDRGERRPCVDDMRTLVWM